MLPLHDSCKINTPIVECTSPFLCFFHWLSTVRVRIIKKAVVAVDVHLVRRGSGNSARLRRIRAVTRDSDRTESAEGVVSPVVGWCEYLGKLELDKWTLPHAVEILATTVL